MKEEQNLEKYTFTFEALNVCAICGNPVFIPNNRIAWLGNEFWYVVCPGCGVKFMNPRPTQESYRVFYKDLFWQQKIRNLGFHQSGQAWQADKYKWDNEEKWDPEFGRQNVIEKTRSLRVEGITKILQAESNLSSETDILEVGCSFPLTLQSLKENFDCRVFAIEPSIEAQAEIFKLNYIKFVGSYAEDLEIVSQQTDKFDIIIFSHVLENTVDPVAVIRFAGDCLKPGGIIYIQTPNLLVNDQMNPYHPYIFSHNSLKMVCHKAGLNYKSLSWPIERMLTAIFRKNK